MKRILVVFTGGTIGSVTDNKTINVNESTGFELIKAFKNHSNIDVDFDTIRPLNILSENIVPGHWEKLHKAIRDVDTSIYDGIIITHGSDTIPYTAAFMGYLFGNTKIPIVLTASNHPLGHDKSNGLDNFISSVAFICNEGLLGVFVVFQNNIGDSIVYLATRLMESDHYNDQYESFADIIYGTIRNGEFIQNPHTHNPSREALGNVSEKLHLEDITFNNEVFALKAFPGLNYKYIDLETARPKAILHNLYHSATGCTHNGDHSLIDFITRCNDNNIDVYLMSFKDTNMDLYATNRALIDSGGIPFKNISFEAAITKLWVAYNQKVMPPREFMKMNVYYEHLGY